MEEFYKSEEVNAVISDSINRSPSDDSNDQNNNDGLDENSNDDQSTSKSKNTKLQKFNEDIICSDHGKLILALNNCRKSPVWKCFLLFLV